MRIKRVDSPVDLPCYYWAGATWRPGVVSSKDNFGRYIVLGEDGGYYYGMRRDEIRFAGERVR